ncbi:AMP-dependent synthetase/ligase [Amycolatopsis sp. NPDC059090]|uniref:AMP-dependent synthetase/ligase n=1 Tax=unclassified Amycolatopsis TaxID=2618356 RepID=UPI00366D4C61
MREYRTPELVPIPDTATTADAPAERAGRSPGQVVLRRRTAEGWTDVTAASFHDEVRALAAGLIESGVAAGDRVALLSRTRYEWTLLDYAIWYAGAVTVPIYPTASATQIAHVLRDSGAVAALVETAEHRALVLAAGLPAERATVIDDAGLAGLSGRAGAASLAAVAARRAERNAADLATIVYTSGTTGVMKGCALSHRNLLAMARNTIADIPAIFAEPGGSTVLFLPLAHSFARFVQIAAVESGLVLGHLPDPSSIMTELPVFRPTFLPAVPRVLQKIFDTAVRTATEEGKGGPFRQAIEIAIEYSRAQSGEGPKTTLRMKHAMMDKIVYGRLREAVGGAEYAVSGGAALGERLAHFYRGIGITVLEGYGLTETTAPVTANVPGKVSPGTVGRPVPGNAIRLAEDGEILVSGPTVFSGYWQDERATKEVLDPDGWLSTGDLGAIDDDGYLSVVGRKKEVIVTASGKNVVPEPLEDLVRAHPLVSHCVLVGDGRPFVACLIALDADELRFRGAGPEPNRDPALLAEIELAVAAANEQVSAAESIKKFAVLDRELDEEHGHLTASLKVRRAAVVRDFAADIEALYRG